MASNMKENNMDRPADGGPTKKLRSCEPDLKVVLSDSDVRWYAAPTLASKSKYVDAMLASPMKERESMVINFNDVTAEVWDSMMTFVEDPSAARKMTVEDAMKVAKTYDQYDFAQGRQLCSDVLQEYAEEMERVEKRKIPDLDKIIDVALLAHETHLDKARNAAMNYICGKMNSTAVPYGRTMFEGHHLDRLVPLLLELGDGMPEPWFFWGEEDIRKPDFPTRFVERSSAWLSFDLLQKSVPLIELSGTNCNADGEFELNGFDCQSYHSDREVVWGGVRVKFTIELRHKEGWSIVRETIPEMDEDDDVVETVCWVSPYSKNLPLPPKSNWKSVDPLARGQPKIKRIPENEA